MKKVLMVGCFGFNYTTLAQFSAENPALVRNDFNEITDTNTRIKMPITNSFNDDFEVVLSEKPRSKFIDKPRHNFRKR